MLLLEKIIKIPFYFYRIAHLWKKENNNNYIKGKTTLKLMTVTKVIFQTAAEVAVDWCTFSNPFVTKTKENRCITFEIHVFPQKIHSYIDFSSPKTHVRPFLPKFKITEQIISLYSSYFIIQEVLHSKIACH